MSKILRLWQEVGSANQAQCNGKYCLGLTPLTGEFKSFHDSIAAASVLSAMIRDSATVTCLFFIAR